MLLAASAMPGAARTTVTVSGSGSDDAVFEVTDNLVLDLASQSGSLVVKESPSRQTLFSISDNTVLKFTSYSGVSDIPADNSGVALRNNPVETTLDFTAAPGQSCRLSVYSLQGAALISLDAWNGESVDVSTLAAGLYIVNFNNQSLKFYKK